MIAEVDPSGRECRASDEHCITCSDDGAPMRVVSAEGDQALCLDDGDRMHEVAIDLIGAVTAGDEVLVHAGVAIRHLRLGR
jgi:hydrogenase maturation factor